MSKLRASHICKKSILYNVTLGLEQGKNFFGEITTTFSLKKDKNGKISDLFFDCELSKIKKIVVNNY